MTYIHLNVELDGDRKGYNLDTTTQGNYSDIGEALGQGMADQAPELLPVFLVACAQYFYERDLIGDVELDEIKEMAEDASGDVYEALTNALG